MMGVVEHEEERRHGPTGFDEIWMIRAGVPDYGLPEPTNEPTVATRSSGSTGFRT
jgi:hypothetical protein